MKTLKLTLLALLSVLCFSCEKDDDEPETTSHDYSYYATIYKQSGENDTETNDDTEICSTNVYIDINSDGTVNITKEYFSFVPTVAASFGEYMIPSASYTSSQDGITINQVAAIYPYMNSNEFTYAQYQNFNLKCTSTSISGTFQAIYSGSTLYYRISGTAN